ncbi:MAG TPA: MerR family transcriptional regulator [Bacteroidales bacterium]|nr:MerR family transcriptional regulator [Bacteroidales bacterium]
MAKQEKVYYHIGEVAEKFNVNTSLIRFWEKEFDVLRPHKNKKGNRMFTEKDMRNLHIIFHLVKEKGYTLQGAKDALKAGFEVVEKDVTIKETLQKSLNFLKGLDQLLAEKQNNQKKLPFVR